MNRLQAVVSGWAFGMLITFFAMMVGRGLFIIINSYEGSGIIMSPDKEAVYISGEACTVNYTPNQLVMYQRMKWCYEEYVRHEIE